MTLISTILLLFQTFSYAQPQDLKLLGSRPPHCKTSEDAKTLTIAEEFITESQEKIDSGTFSIGLVAGNHCFRVGTEILLQMATGEVQYLGKALISKVQLLSASDLLSNKNLQPFKTSSIEQHISLNPGKTLNLIHFKVMEKVSNTTLNKKYDRLQTCFVSYADWETYPLDKDKWEEELDDIKTGVKKADIWNGTNNCYKIGVAADIKVKGQTHKMGKIKPTTVYLTHYTQVTADQARILGETLTDLKERLEKKKDIAGGYTTMVVYDYEAPKVQPAVTN